MSSISRLLENELGFDEVFGDRSVFDDKRNMLQKIRQADPRALKIADIAIAITKDVIDPSSPLATKRVDRGVPILISHPQVPANDGNQLMMFKHTLEIMAVGHGYGKDAVRMPYKKDVYPVLTDHSLSRMILGHVVDIDDDTEWIIPGTVEKLLDLEAPRLRGQTDVLPHELALPDYFQFMSVFARADRNGVNADLFEQAMDNYTQLQKERNANK
jgi:hypothetical protein